MQNITKRKIKKSEDYYVKSNQLILSVQRNSLYENQNYIKKLIKFFESNDTEEMSSDIPKDKGKGLIFIIGMPRSGTTLLESIIATADDCVPGGEKIFFSVQCQPIIYNKSTDTKKEDVFSRLGKDYLDIIDIQKNGRKFYIDKLPENYLYYKFIRNSLPGAKFLHIFRDPWDTATSIFKQNFQDALFWSSSFFGIALQYANYEYIMKLWQSEKNNDILDISYEELVSDTESSINKIWDFCELEGNYDENRRKTLCSNSK